MTASSAPTGARNGGRLLVDALRVHGVDRLFCVPGESYLEVLDALYDTPQIALVVAKHEGAAANMAEADGKLTGRPGICFVTRGPGATHGSIGVHTAYHDSTPMILFIGQVQREVRGREAFQEVEFRQMFAPLAKWVAEIESADRIPEYVLRAFQVATSGRPGPVVLSLPEDVLAEESSACDTQPYQAVQAAPGDRDLAALRDELQRASRPLLIVGGSSWSDAGCAALARFADANALPVLASFRRQDLIDNRHRCYAGHLSLGLPPFLQQRVKAADLIVALGSRLGDVTTLTYSVLKPPRIAARLVHVHPDANELNRVYQADLPIVAAPSAAAERLAAIPPVESARWREWTDAARREYEKFLEIPEEGPRQGVDMAVVIRHLATALPANATIANGAGNFTVWVHRFFTYKAPRTELAPTSGAMGYGFPAAIAAALRHPDRLTVCIAGDGDFLMYPQELATAAQYGARVLVLVVNNGMYGTIRMHQERRFPGRVSGTGLAGPDFVALAQSFGAHAERVETTEDFAPAFERALAAGRSAVLELRVDPNQITPDRRI
ncbi:MAG TPA: thiamine pyrophosphate-binding protein [Vicinamibacterales bacterium]|nr:thiamine pyrophosphate-binding protein [Vicinamibacterales bacterium]